MPLENSNQDSDRNQRHGLVGRRLRDCSVHFGGAVLPAEICKLFFQERTGLVSVHSPPGEEPAGGMLKEDAFSSGQIELSRGAPASL